MSKKLSKRFIQRTSQPSPKAPERKAQSDSYNAKQTPKTKGKVLSARIGAPFTTETSYKSKWQNSLPMKLSILVILGTLGFLEYRFDKNLT